MATLILTVGLPRSGKTTWARQQGAPIVCPDAIRLALHGHRFIDAAEPYVWAVAKTMVRALFYAGHQTVILDACNGTRKRRDEWKSEHWRREFQIFTTPVEECRARALREGDSQVLPSVDRMAARWEPPTGEELEDGH